MSSLTKKTSSVTLKKEKSVTKEFMFEDSLKDPELSLIWQRITKSIKIDTDSWCYFVPAIPILGTSILWFKFITEGGICIGVTKHRFLKGMNSQIGMLKNEWSFSLKGYKWSNGKGEKYGREVNEGEIIELKVDRSEGSIGV